MLALLRWAEAGVLRLSEPLVPLAGVVPWQALPERLLGRRGIWNRHSAVLTPVSEHHLTGILGSVPHCPRGVGAQYIAETIGDLNLTIGTQQSPILLRLPVQHDCIVGIRLVERDDHAGAVFLQVLGDFHPLVVRIKRRSRAK